MLFDPTIAFLRARNCEYLSGRTKTWNPETEKGIRERGFQAMDAMDAINSHGTAKQGENITDKN